MFIIQLLYCTITISGATVATQPRKLNIQRIDRSRDVWIYLRIGELWASDNCCEWVSVSSSGEQFSGSQLRAFTAFESLRSHIINSNA